MAFLNPQSPTAFGIALQRMGRCRSSVIWLRYATTRRCSTQQTTFGGKAHSLASSRSASG